MMKEGETLAEDLKLVQNVFGFFFCFVFFFNFWVYVLGFGLVFLFKTHLDLNSYDF